MYANNQQSNQKIMNDKFFVQAKKYKFNKNMYACNTS